MRFLAIILACISLIGCEPGIIDELPVEPPRMVVQAEPMDGKPWLVYLTHTYATLDPASNYDIPPGPVPGATVKLFDNGQFSEDLTATGPPDKLQSYVSSNGPQQGHTYTLKVEAPNYQPITATYTQPAPVILEDVGIEYLNAELYNENSNIPSAYFQVNIDVQFTDPVGDNYYQVALIRSSSPDPSNSDYAATEYIVSRRPDQRTNFIVGAITDDVRFSGQKTVLPFQSYLNANIVADTVDIPYVTIELRNLSKEYFDFRSYISSPGPSFYDPYAQPAIVKTNVEGGLGIFAGYATSRYTFKLVKPESPN